MFNKPLQQKYGRQRKLNYRYTSIPSRLQEVFKRLQDSFLNFLNNIFTSVLAPQIAVASLGWPRMIRKENNCH